MLVASVTACLPIKEPLLQSGLLEHFTNGRSAFPWLEMHLLHIDRTGHLELKDYIVPDIPAYAILSHTWGEDGDEVTYQDIQEGKGRAKAGFAKIEFCMSQAALDGLEYSWVDTCCIDKTNNTELSEAINSMFRWYTNATKCYVYLPDVSVRIFSDGLNTSGPTWAPKRRPPAKEWQSDFRKSRWFTRGWTLQELLAPKIVEFFSAELQLLCDRLSGLDLIADITSIPTEALKGRSLLSFTVEERMSWTRTRRTKREEDQAYCLLGIFDVSMPLIYGEGIEKAMARLKKKIAKPSIVAEVTRKLQSIAGAAFNSREDEGSATCLEYTRVELRYQIETWAKSLDDKSVYWLNGLAGTGKSTVARTIARSFSRQQILGASFFFKRGAGDRSRASLFFTTIAVQLATRMPFLASRILDAVLSQPGIEEKSLEEQFDQLLYIPLLAVLKRQATLPSYLIVIDAIDECDSETDIRTMIRLLGRLKDVSLRVLITSRPELPIRVAFRRLDQTTYKHFILHEIPSDVVEKDIALFLEHEFQIIREDHELPSGWPGRNIIADLAHMATPLFIVASTVCRYVSSSGTDPTRQLNLFMQYDKEGQLEGLERLYLAILDQMFSKTNENERKTVTNHFRQVVGAIVLLSRPLSAVSLASLLSVDEHTVASILRPLHSVLHIPTDKTRPVRLFHQSFRDFLVDCGKEGKSPFWIDEEQTHLTLSIQCMAKFATSTYLRHRISYRECRHANPSDMSEGQLEAMVPLDLQYACRSWVYHMIRVDYAQRIVDIRHVQILVSKRLLYWLEAMGLLGCIQESMDTVTILEELRMISTDDALLNALTDARRFILRNMRILQEAPVQVYSSALLFAPTNSITKANYLDHLPCWVRSLPQMQEDYGACEQTLDTHSGPVTAVALSPFTGHQRSQIARGMASGKIELWGAIQGDLQHSLQGHVNTVRALAFSPNAKLLVSAPEEGAVKIWDSMSGTLVREYPGVVSGAQAVTFSTDGLMVVISTSDGTLRFWHYEKFTGSIRVFNSELSCTCIYASETCLIACLDSSARRVWIVDAKSKVTRLGLFEQSANHITTLIFSPDGRSVAAGTVGGMIRLWDATNGSLQQTLEDRKCEIMSLAMSGNARVLASANSLNIVTVWSVKTGNLLYSYTGHSQSITSLVSDKDGRIVISGSNDGTTKTWLNRSLTRTKAEVQQAVPVTMLLFSRHGETIVTASLDGTIRIWDPTMMAPRFTHLHGTVPSALELSSHGDVYVAGYQTGSLMTVCTQSGNILQQGHIHSTIDLIKISPDQEVIAIASSTESCVSVRDRITREVKEAFGLGGQGGITSLTFSENGKKIATGFNNGAVIVWDLGTGTKERSYHGASGDVVSDITFSPYDKTLVAATFNDRKSSTFRVCTWDVDSGEPLQVFVPDETVYSSRISPVNLLAAAQGNILAAADLARDNSVQTWRQATPVVPYSPYRSREVLILNNIWYSANGTLCTNRGQFSDHPNSIFVGKDWIYHEGNPMLHIPNEYRSAHVAVAGTKIAIGCTSGEVIYFDLDFNATDKISPKAPKPVKPAKPPKMRPQVPNKPSQLSGRKTEIAERKKEITGSAAVDRPLDDFPDYFQHLEVPNDLKGFARSPRPAPKPPGAVTRR